MEQNAAFTQYPYLYQLLRPKQWIKNFFVFAPLLFSGHFFHPHAIEQSLLAFFLFCIAASATYLFNDLYDLEADRTHPVKAKTRPLAMGVVQPRTAWILWALCISILLSAWFFVPRIMSVITGYLIMTCFYTTIFKHYPIVDLFIIAMGFVCRVNVGAFAISVPISHWMLITTMALALYLATIKRRQEYVHTGTDHRKVLHAYSLPLLDHYAQLASISALIFYSLFVLSSKPQLTITIPMVLFGLFRYAFITHQKHDGESPTDALIHDKPLIMTVLIWTLSCLYILYEPL